MPAMSLLPSPPAAGVSVSVPTGAVGSPLGVSVPPLLQAARPTVMDIARARASSFFAFFISLPPK